MYTCTQVHFTALYVVLTMDEALYLLESGMLLVVVVTLDFPHVGTLQILMDVLLVKLLEHYVMVSIPIDDLLETTHYAIRKNYYLMCQWTV